VDKEVVVVVVVVVGVLVKQYCHKAPVPSLT